MDRRARVLTEEYTKKARNVDRVYGGAAEEGECCQGRGEMGQGEGTVMVGRSQGRKVVRRGMFLLD